MTPAPTERGIIASDKSTVGRRGRRPLHRQRSLCLLEFYCNKIHRLLRGVSSSQKNSGATLIFREPYIFVLFVGIVGCPHRSAPTERGIIAFDKSTVGRRGRRPLHHQHSLRLLEFYCNKIHRLLRGVSSSQKISGTTLIFREPYISHT